MCGIVSYIGNKPAKGVLLQGLKSLEYRGYDSSGIAVLDDREEIKIEKTQGKISDLETKLKNTLEQALNSSTCGIGHTRWATHGEANDTNAHPHQDDHQRIALVHNGIINNYLDLKTELESDGFKFKTDTDTEVIANLFAKYKNKNTEDLDVLRAVVKRLEGSYAIAMIVSDSLKAHKRKILVAKNQSPLVIGVGDGENFVASDSATVLQFTDKILRLKDKQVAELTATNIDLRDLDGNKVRNEIQQLVQTASLLEKGPYKHFLLKEIHEQPVIISHMLDTSIHSVNEAVKGFESLTIDFTQINRIVFVACGSAYHAALLGKYLVELWTKIPVEVAIASEFCSMPSITTHKDLVIGISQSGETADTLAAITNAALSGTQVMAITNKMDSAIYELCKPNAYVTPAGTEVSVASTKAFTSQVMALYLLALKIAEDIKVFRAEELIHIKQQLRSLPLIIDQVIDRYESYHDQFLKYSAYRDFLFLSRGINYPIALEGALKLKELSYIHATGYPSGEMKHGPIAILDHNVPVLSIAINGKTKLEQTIYQKTLHNAEEARARKSPSLVLACDSNSDVVKIFDEIIRIPDIDQIFSPLVATIPLQFLAYYIAEDLGKDVDQPRNLAKSVTVE